MLPSFGFITLIVYLILLSPDTMTEHANSNSIFDQLNEHGSCAGLTTIVCQEFAEYMDSKDELRCFRDEFHFPPGKKRSSQIYLCGNSLGLQPKRKIRAFLFYILITDESSVGTESYVMQYMRKWATEGVHGHFIGNEVIFQSMFFKS